MVTAWQIQKVVDQDADSINAIWFYHSQCVIDLSLGLKAWGKQ
jgi:hypothetical protein